MLNIFGKNKTVSSNFKTEAKKKRVNGLANTQMIKNVRKVLESADQKLIVMVRG